MVKDREQTKAQILAALQHQEAEDGLYFRNLGAVHEDEERPVVEGDQETVLEALKELIGQGLVSVDDRGEEPIFSLVRQ